MRKQKLKALVTCVALSTVITTGILPSAESAFATTKKEVVEGKQNNSTKRNVMYYGDWSIWGGQGNFYPKDIPADQLTHLNFAFIDFDANGNLAFTDTDAAVGAPVGQEGVQWSAPNAGVLIALQELRAKNPNLKIGISVGGWSKSGDFSLIARDAQKRANFIKNILSFLEYTNMDFVDLDWEYPAIVRQPDLVDNKNDEGTVHSIPEDKENYAILLEELRAELDKKGKEIGKKYELSVALPGDKGKMDTGLDIERIFNAVDFANIMSYDLRGAWDDYSGHQTPLYANENDPINKDRNLSIDEEVKYLTSKGVSPDKIVIGAAYYSRGWDKVAKGDSDSAPGLFQKAEKSSKDADQTPSYGAPNEAPLTSGDGGRSSGVWSYRNLDKLKAKYPGLKEYWDDVAKAPYLYDESTGKFFTYENTKSITEKTKYVKNNELGGMIAWMASQDKPTSSTKRDELTVATKKGLFGDTALPKHEIVYSDLDVEAKVSSYEQAWGQDRKGYEIVVKNNEKAEESNAVLKAVERSSETIKAPKLYIKADKPLKSGDYTAGTVTFENGYTVIDLQSVWEGKNIEQGQSYKFKLLGDAKIQSIEIVQRMSANSPEMNRQTIYGENTDGGGEVTPPENTVPVLEGINDLTINVGDSFDALNGVKAKDKEDGDLTSKIKVEGSVDTKKAGKYTLTYSVEDSKGLKATKERVVTVKEVVEEKPNFGVGEGIEWPVQVNSPYADMVAWNDKAEFSNNGALNLKKIANDTGMKFFNLAFIQSTGGVTDGKLNWGWGGHSVLSEKNPDNDQYKGIKKSIKEIREIGGDVAVSFGGLNGVAPWEATSDINVLFNTYKEIVEGYGLTRIDLDIEGPATNKESNRRNAKAIKKLQDATDVDVVLTLAVLPSGLTQVQLDVLEAYLSEGVDIKLVNIMTMCYGEATLNPGENYGTASLRAVDSTKDQLKEYFKKYGNITLSDGQAYGKIGTTPSVGFEGEAHPTFNADWTELVVNHAIKRKIGMTSMWSINRDSMAQGNKGINKPYEHSNLFKKFGDGSVEVPNQAPKLNGVVDKTITVGDSFNPLEGITSWDNEDGDLTKKITITGEVNTAVAGKYELVYSVKDSENKTTTAKRAITVKAKDEGGVEGDTYDPEKVYLAGDTVIYKGRKYTAKWWVKGENPDKSQAWEAEAILNPDGSIQYEEGMVCTGGQKVSYNGKVYEAKWWTNTTPGSDDSWKLVG